MTETPAKKDAFNEAALRTPEGVKELMADSASGKEWSENADRVVAANGGDYPRFWYDTVEASGLATKTWAKFNR